MKRYLLCVCLGLSLLFCGCNQNTVAPLHSATTTIVTHTTDTAVSSTHSTIATTQTTIGSSTDAVTTSNPHNTATSTTNTIHTTVTAIPSSMSSSNSTSISVTTPSSTTTTATTTGNKVVFQATVRENINNRPVSGVYVTVWLSADVMIGSAVTDDKGVAQITMPKQSLYRVRLSNLPHGYEANEEYRFSTNTVNITIKKAAVQNELDHSQAQYDIGKTMTDFSLTDTDGTIHRLSELLKEKQLVVLDFWYTACEPCKQEFPFFESALQTYGDDMALLAIDPIDSLNAIKALRNKLDVTFPMMKDTCNLYLGFDVTSYPVTVFIGAGGRILDIHTGAFQTESEFLATIKKYLL